MSAGAPRKPAFPRQRVGDDGFQIVKARLPSERGMDALAGGDDVRWVARPARGELDLEIDARDALDGFDHLKHRMSATVATIERGGDAAAAQIGECLAVRGDEIANVNIIADASTVRRRIVGAEHLHIRSPAERGLERELDELGGGAGRV